MNIRTKWIPDPRLHWSAVDDDTYSGPGSPIGMGSTEAAAIADLLERLESDAGQTGGSTSEGK